MSNTPIAQFHRWWDEAKDAEPTLHDAVALATVDAGGIPDVRMVLCKGVDAEGFVFYTNLGSKKAADLASNPHASMVFHWKSLARQVRISGSVEPVSDDVADAYFASRARLSQIAAWASRQSQPLDAMSTLAARADHFTAKFEGAPVPRPPFWSGYCLKPTWLEFWQELPFRMHRREVFRRVDGGWEAELVQP